MKLYEIIKEIDNFEFKVDENGEILNLMQLDELELEKNEKIENIALYIKNLKSDTEELKKEEENLMQRRRVKEKKVEALKDYLSQFMQGEKFETPKVKIGWRKSEKVEITDDFELPESYYRVKREIDKTRVKEDLKQGIEIAGAKIIENCSIQIK